MIERADKTSRILDVKYYILLPSLSDISTSVDQVGWTALLNSASALQMYRQQHHNISPRKVAQFLLLDAEFPRSIRHGVHRLQESLHCITGTRLGGYQNEAERLVGMLRGRLDYASIDSIMDGGLHEYLDELQQTLNDIGEAIGQRFFGHDARPSEPSQTQNLH
jgi:uncharacterized alpha-E superfamily protein